MWYHKIVC